MFDVYVILKCEHGRSDKLYLQATLLKSSYLFFRDVKYKDGRKETRVLVLQYDTT